MSGAHSLTPVIRTGNGMIFGQLQHREHSRGRQHTRYEDELKIKLDINSAEFESVAADRTS